MQLVSSPSPLAGEGRERGRTSQLDPSDKAVGRAQPPLPQERVSHPSPPGRRCRAAADEGETPLLPTPLTRPSATLLPPGEGAAQRRMREKRRCFPRPSPQPSPARGEGARSPFDQWRYYYFNGIGAKNADYRGGVTCLYDTQLLGACLHAFESGGRSRPEAVRGMPDVTIAPPAPGPRRGGRLSAWSAQPLSTGGCGRVCLGFWVLDL